MEEGFIPDLTYGASKSRWWHPGRPITILLGVLQLENEKKLSVETFRCTGCGFLESYAKSTGDTAPPD